VAFTLPAGVRHYFYNRIARAPVTPCLPRRPALAHFLPALPSETATFANSACSSFAFTARRTDRNAGRSPSLQVVALPYLRGNGADAALWTLRAAFLRYTLPLCQLPCCCPSLPPPFCGRAAAFTAHALHAAPGWRMRWRRNVAVFSAWLPSLPALTVCVCRCVSYACARGILHLPCNTDSMRTRLLPPVPGFYTVYRGCHGIFFFMLCFAVRGLGFCVVRQT